MKITIKRAGGALKRFGKDLVAADSELAYDRAGKSFAGQMQQTFVVLHDSYTDARVNAGRVKSEVEKGKKKKKKSEGAGSKSGAGIEAKSEGFRSSFGSGKKK